MGMKFVFFVVDFFRMFIEGSGVLIDDVNYYIFIKVDELGIEVVVVLLVEIVEFVIVLDVILMVNCLFFFVIIDE